MYLTVNQLLSQGLDKIWTCNWNYNMTQANVSGLAYTQTFVLFLNHFNLQEMTIKLKNLFVRTDKEC